MQRVDRHAAIVVVLLLRAIAPANAQAVPDSLSAQSACADPTYVSLRQKPVDQLTARELAYVTEARRACEGEAKPSTVRQVLKVTAVVVGVVVAVAVATWVF